VKTRSDRAGASYVFRLSSLTLIDCKTDRLVGFHDASCVWDAHQPMPLAAISGSSPFRCVDAAGDRLVAGDQKGNVWFLAPICQLYEAR
jgi:hypothetical protein